MGEQLLKQKDLCVRLGVGRGYLRKILPGLLADGLQAVKLPPVNGSRPTIRYRLASLDQAIDRAARRGEMLGVGK
jgi:hypothetical protein